MLASTSQAITICNELLVNLRSSPDYATDEKLPQYVRLLEAMMAITLNDLKDYSAEIDENFRNNLYAMRYLYPEKLQTAIANASKQLEGLEKISHAQEQARIMQFNQRVLEYMLPMLSSEDKHAYTLMLAYQYNTFLQSYHLPRKCRTHTKTWEDLVKSSMVGFPEFPLGNRNSFENCVLLILDNYLHQVTSALEQHKCIERKVNLISTILGTAISMALGMIVGVIFAPTLLIKIHTSQKNHFLFNPGPIEITDKTRFYLPNLPTKILLGLVGVILGPLIGMLAGFFHACVNQGIKRAVKLPLYLAEGFCIDLHQGVVTDFTQHQLANR